MKGTDAEATEREQIVQDAGVALRSSYLCGKSFAPDAGFIIRCGRDEEDEKSPEEQMDNDYSPVPLWNLLECPELYDPEALSTEEIVEEIQFLIGLMISKGIVPRLPENADPTELYREMCDYIESASVDYRDLVATVKEGGHYNIPFYADEEEPEEEIPETSVHEFIGAPSFEPLETLSDVRLPSQLERLKKLLAARDIVVDSFEPVAPREMYRFITEIVFNETVLILDPDGGLAFVYEEYHPFCTFIADRTFRRLTDLKSIHDRWDALFDLFSPAGVLDSQNYLFSRSELIDFCNQVRDSYPRLDYTLKEVHHTTLGEFPFAGTLLDIRWDYRNQDRSIFSSVKSLEETVVVGLELRPDEEGVQQWYITHLESSLLEL